MIYGLNFGGPAIPDTPRTAFRKFPERITANPCKCTCKGCERTHRDDTSITRLTLRLVGIGQSPEERDRMLVVAHNGTRRIHVVDRLTAGGTWYGIYAY